MRKLVFVLALFLLLAAQIGQAATLDSSWYVKVNWVNVYNYQWDPINHYYRKVLYDGSFTTPQGQYGAFAVSNPYNDFVARLVTVPNNVYASPADSLVLPFTAPSGLANANIDFSCQTNYDPSQMYVSLWQVLENGTGVELWSQMNGGQQVGRQGLPIFQSVTSSNYYFLVSVVPEPSSLCALGTACLGMGWFGLRRRTRRA